MIGWQRAVRSPGKSSRCAHFAAQYFVARFTLCIMFCISDLAVFSAFCVAGLMRCILRYWIVLFDLCFVCIEQVVCLCRTDVLDLVSVSRRPVAGNGGIVRCLIVIVTVLCLLLPPGCAPSTTSSCLSQQVSWVGAVHQHTPVRLMWFVCKLGRCALPLHSLSLSHQLIHCCAGPRTLFWSKTAACRGESVHSAGLTPHR